MCGWESLTGTFSEAAVEGLMSWVGEGWRFREADWSVEASSMAGLEDIVSGCSWWWL